MFYQCMKCLAIHESSTKAEKCCMPNIVILDANEVSVCIHHDIFASVCMLCKGTGLIKKDNLVRIK